MPTPESIRIIIVVAFFVLLAIGMKKPVYAACAYMVLVYCDVSAWYPVFATVKSELVFALLILIRLFALGDSTIKLSLNYSSLNRYMFYFVLSISVSFLFALDRQHSWDEAVYHFIKVLVVCVIILLSIETKQDLKIFSWFFLTMFAYLSYEAVYGFLTGIGGSKQMYGINYVTEKGILAGHVALANNMNQMIPIGFFLISSVKNRIYKVIASIPLCVFIVALIGSGSRGGIVGLMFFCVVSVWFSKNRAKNMVIVGIAVIMMFAYSETIRSTGSRIDKQATTGRLLGLVHGIEIVRAKHHILGAGPGCFILARQRYFGYSMQSHNIYGQVIGDLGVPGVITWFLLVRQIFLNIAASKKRLKALSLENDFLYKLCIGIQVSLMVRLFVSMASHGLYYFYWYVMAVLSIAIMKIVEYTPGDFYRNKAQI